MKFSYFKFPLVPRSEFFGNYILKPIISVKVINGNNSLNYDALIDSGADFCIFDAEIGEVLEIDVKSGRKEIFGGIQEKGGAEAFFHNVKINIGGWEYKTKIGFSYDIAKHGYGILGQKGFFDIFSVKFDYLKAEIEIKEGR
jgi:predicted aspartyl protease